MDIFVGSPSTPGKNRGSFGSGRKRAFVGSSNTLNVNTALSPRGKVEYFSKGGNFSPQREKNRGPESPSVKVESPHRSISTGLSKRSPVSLTSPDRFIPSRANLNLDYCNHAIMHGTGVQGNEENASGMFSLSSSANINGDSTAKRSGNQKTPTQIKFDGELYALSGVSPGKRLMSHFERSVDQRSDPNTEQALLQPLEVSHQHASSCNTGPMRALPSGPSRILDAPDLVDDYYLNLLSWGDNNTIAVALQKSVYLWHAADGSIDQLCTLAEDSDDYVTSVEWCRENSNMLAIGTATSGVELWDVAHMRKVRTFQGHTARVSSLAWNGTTLTSGSRDSLILNHDMRAQNSMYSKFVGHQQEVCGLSWSPDGRMLASGGNENLLCLWDPAVTQQYESSSVTATSGSHLRPLYTLDQHQAAVKALAWCPFHRHTLASGGGTADRTIRIWNVSNGSNVKTVDSGSQVCALQWNEQHKELLSSHGFSDNQLCLWKYPSMTKIKEFRGHTSRVLHLARSPDGSTVVSAGADETLRFWEIFGTPSPNSKTPFKSSMLADPGSLSRTLGHAMLSLR